MQSIEKKRVVVGMSGGIDSSMAAVLLKKQGYECIGVQMIYWTEDLCKIPKIVQIEGEEVATTKDNRFRKIVENKCCSDESLLLSRNICKFLEIPFYTYNVKENFKRSIVDFYLEGYTQGITPNPCIECNKYIKFGELLDFAKKIGAEYIATGHYARILFDKKNSSYELYEAKDKTKDQSYFLSGLTQAQLAQTILPLGEFEKSTIRLRAEEEGLTAYKKSYKESQGLCFFGEKTPHAFLERNLTQSIIQPGNIVTEEGKIVGKHNGTIYYTIGQRKGLDIGGLPEPYFVIELRAKSREVVVGPKARLYKTMLLIRNLHFTSQKREGPMEVKIRYRMQRVPCLLHSIENDTAILTCTTPVYAITPGQVAVLQDGEHILGQAIIDKCIDTEEKVL